MKLYQKLLLGFALVALLVGCVGYVAQVMNSRVEYGVLQLSEGAASETNHAIEMTLALRESQALAGELVARRSEVSAKALRTALLRFEQQLAQGRSVVSATRARAEAWGRGEDLDEASDRLAWIDELGLGFSTYQQHAERLIDLTTQRPSQARAFLAETVTPHVQKAMLPPLTQYRNRVDLAFKTETEAVRAHLARADRMLFVAVLLTIGMTLVLGILIANSISAPILSLMKATERIGRGDLDFQLDVRSDDEVGALTGAFNTMAEALSQTTVSKHYLDTILHSMADPLFVVSEDGFIQMVNDAVVDTLGYEKEMLIGRPLGFVFAGGVVETDTLLGDVLRRGHSGNRETVLQQREGAELPVAFSAAAMTGDEGEVQGIVCLAKDMTQQKLFEAELIRAKEQAEEVSRLKSNFLANMSHEIRTPLTGIIGSAQVLTGELEGEHREMVETMGRAGIRLLGTINSVLDMARIEAGALHPQPEPVEVADEVADAISVLRPLALGKGLRLALFEATPGVWASADPDCLHRICVNLIGNAIKFTKQGEVVAEVDDEPDAAVLRVSDTGIGISEAFLPQLFDSFKQESTGMERSHEGTGLGLAITKRLVDLMGGTIEVQSAKGTGSTFTVRLPHLDTAARPPVGNAERLGAPV
ncbi:MAG: ATP-binding protein [Bacteroidota bacterium]